MSTDQKEVRIWTLKEGRDKQWIHNGPWIGRGRTVEVVPLSDYADLQSKVEELARDEHCAWKDKCLEQVEQLEDKDQEIVELKNTCSFMEDNLHKKDDKITELMVEINDLKKWKERSKSFIENIRKEEQIKVEIIDKALNKGADKYPEEG